MNNKFIPTKKYLENFSSKLLEVINEEVTFSKLVENTNLDDFLKYSEENEDNHSRETIGLLDQQTLNDYVINPNVAIRIVVDNELDNIENFYKFSINIFSKKTEFKSSNIYALTSIKNNDEHKTLFIENNGKTFPLKDTIINNFLKTLQKPQYDLKIGLGLLSTNLTLETSAEGNSVTTLNYQDVKNFIITEDDINIDENGDIMNTNEEDLTVYLVAPTNSSILPTDENYEKSIDTVFIYQKNRENSENSILLFILKIKEHPIYALTKVTLKFNVLCRNRHKIKSKIKSLTFSLGATLAKNKKIDLIICLDCSGSMTRFMDYFVTLTNNMLKKLAQEMIESTSYIKEGRFKLIGFGSYDEDLRVTRFFSLPEESELLLNASIDTFGTTMRGAAENGLVALESAIKSNWDETADKHIIALYTDETSYLPPPYPEVITSPISSFPYLNNLETFWNTMDADKKHILLHYQEYTGLRPPEYFGDLSWNIVTVGVGKAVENWDNVTHIFDSNLNNLLYSNPLEKEIKKIV